MARPPADERPLHGEAHGKVPVPLHERDAGLPLAGEVIELRRGGEPAESRAEDHDVRLGSHTSHLPRLRSAFD